MGNWKTRECWNRNGNAKSDVANLIFGPGMMATENVEKVEISKDDGFSDPMLFQLMPCSDILLDRFKCLLVNFYLTLTVSVTVPCHSAFDVLMQQSRELHLPCLIDGAQEVRG